MKLYRSILLSVLCGTAFSPAAVGEVSHSMLGNTCAGCHGTNGHSAEPMPIIAGLSDDEYLAETMKSYRSGRRPSTIMGRLARGYSDKEIEAMAEFFASQNWISPKQDYDTELANRGEKIHNEKCESCHRDGGRYSDEITPRIAGQWRVYLEVVMEEYWRPERKMPHTFMNVVISRLHSQDLKALAHYYASQR